MEMEGQLHECRTANDNGCRSSERLDAVACGLDEFRRAKPQPNHADAALEVQKFTLEKDREGAPVGCYREGKGCARQSCGTCSHWRA